jgi:uncharacterized protein (TIGR03000 family)
MNRTRMLMAGGLACMAWLFATSALLSQDAKGQKATLTLKVPANAVVEIEGVKTKQTGEVRRFESPPLTPGKNYTYTIKVTYKDADGKDVSKEEVVKVQPGGTSEVDLRPAVAAKTEKKTEDKKPATEEKKVAEKEDRRPDVIFVPTPQPVVDRMLELAKVGKDDVVYDLGCGDGRIVVTAVKKFNAKKGVGYDIDPDRIKDSNENVKKNNVGDKVTIEKKDIFTLDLSGANVITLYLLPTLNVKLIPQLDKLKPGSRIVSHDFDMEGVKPDKVEDIEAVDDNGNKRTHKIYLWTVPLKKEKND